LLVLVHLLVITGRDTGELIKKLRG
jgi:hypothetical protein